MNNKTSLILAWAYKPHTCIHPYVVYPGWQHFKEVHYQWQWLMRVKARTGNHHCHKASTNKT